MEVVIVDTADEVGERAASIVDRLIATAPDAVLGLATGSSPQPVYRALVERHRAGTVSFARARVALLDEYVGLPVGHPCAYRSVLRRDLLDHVDLADDALVGPDVHAADLAAACAEYEATLERLGGVDLQLLGIGGDGHIGFNEPSSSLGSRTRIKTLDERTRSDNAGFFGHTDDVPRHVVTQGIATILTARHLVLVAWGEAKADPIAAAVEGPLTAMVPASALQLHPHVTVVVDEAAAGRLRLRDYYRDVLRHKPPWQPH